jgi:hypothetical protein
MAAMIICQLKRIDEATTNPSSSSGPANKLNPQSFIKNKTHQQQAVSTTRQVLPSNIVIKQPISRNIGAETIGTVEVNVNDLLIDIPSDLKELTDRYIQPSPSSQRPTVEQPKLQVGSIELPNSNNALLYSIEAKLINIENKLNMIIKKTKITQKGKKKNVRPRNLGKDL